MKKTISKGNGVDCRGDGVPIYENGADVHYRVTLVRKVFSRPKIQLSSATLLAHSSHFVSENVIS